MSRLIALTAALAVCSLPCCFAWSQEIAARVESPAFQATQASRFALESALRQPTDFEADVSLGEAIELLAAKNKVEIQLDLKALSDLSLDPSNATVARMVRKPVALASMLDMLLGDLDLAYVVRDDAILVTSQTRAEEFLSTRVHRVADLLGKVTCGATIGDLAEAITTAVQPETWSKEGGPGAIAVLGEVLIVSQTRRGHEGVADLLKAMRDTLQTDSGAAPAHPLENLPAAAQPTFTAELRQPTEVEFVDTPLSEALEFLAKKHDIEIQLDHKGISDLGLESEIAPITLSARKPTPLRSVLDRMLDPLDLDWIVRHEVVWITSKTEAEASVAAKPYAVDDLLNRAAGGKWSADDLVAVITSSIQPDSWNENESGAPGAIARLGDILVVAQNREGHEKVAHLLAQLRAAMVKDAGEAPAAPRDADSRDARAAEELKIVSYPVQYLSGDDVVKALTALVAPESWQSNGGAGAVCTVVATAKPDAASKDQTTQSQTVLVVRQTPTIHNQIRRLLGKLDRRPPPHTGGAGFGGGGGFF